jgi:hypothetical protein
MTSPQPTDQKQRVDSADVLRLLVADLRGLADRLELSPQSPGLEQTLKAAQERVCGPRAVVMLLGEHEELKRRFLERLLGPNLAQVPKPTTACTRLEYGVEATPAIAAPQQTARAIRLQNPTLKGGLAVIDTPVLASGEPAANLLECAEQADSWIFVLSADHALNEASQALLRRLPERGARLEMVVEGAETLSSEERVAAREQLMQTLRERCHIETPRLTLVASAMTEGDEANFWQGRFATFHSVMMLRGREHWLMATRAVVAHAMSETGRAIDSALKSAKPGLGHSRLRLGRKDLEGLRIRFEELGRLDGAHLLESKPAEEAPAQSRLDWGGGREPVATPEETAAQTPMALLEEAIAAALVPENAATDAAAQTLPLDFGAELGSVGIPATSEISKTDEAGLKAAPVREIAPEPVTKEALAVEAAAIAPAIAANATTYASPPATSVIASETLPQEKPASVHLAGLADAHPKRRVSVHFSEDVTRLIRHHERGETEARAVIWQRVAVVLLVIAFLCLIVWALSPRGFVFGREPAAEWQYQQPANAASKASAAVATPGTSADPALPVSAHALPDPAGTATPNLASKSLTKPSATIRIPLVRPIPSGETAGAPYVKRRHHHRLLGLGKLWHWVRHPRRRSATGDTNNE